MTSAIMAKLSPFFFFLFSFTHQKEACLSLSNPHVRFVEVFLHLLTSQRTDHASRNKLIRRAFLRIITNSLLLLFFTSH